ncbi:MAG TPA: helix-turn-helix transcriptional regulator [Candidatus Dormibacteraeota bacterium]
MTNDSGAHGRADLVVTIKGRQLTAACAARGWSYTQLAERARISRPTMAAALSGRTIRPSTAWKIARALSQEEAPHVMVDLMDCA